MTQILHAALSAPAGRRDNNLAPGRPLHGACPAAQEEPLGCSRDVPCKPDPHGKEQNRRPNSAQQAVTWKRAPQIDPGVLAPRTLLLSLLSLRTSTMSFHR